MVSKRNTEKMKKYDTLRVSPNFANFFRAKAKFKGLTIIKYSNDLANIGNPILKKFEEDNEDWWKIL